MTKIQEFYDLFEIPKAKYKTLSRTYDADGEVEYYIEEQYPDIEGVFFDLLYEYSQNYRFITKEVKLGEEHSPARLKESLAELYIDTYKSIKDNRELKQTVQDIFKEYIALIEDTD